MPANKSSTDNVRQRTVRVLVNLLEAGMPFPSAENAEEQAENVIKFTDKLLVYLNPGLKK